MLTENQRKQLSEFEQSLIKLYYYEDESREEVAIKLKVPVCSVSYRAEAILEKLEKLNE